ncbi:CueP family metal-binding protein [Microbacterium sp. H1-D42]|uniref:CueP family metal-binding protein n=1 Tax=Microbacterium sp. H1-D42 TaxID=2925844 RepID=UPI001F53D5D2|nr:CueP family metal-binding protein [Microbacterium sp. H1-D42]UNK69637.1 CueP family metal-binding protein [Microbacterium sp. H1-D42]
MRTRIAAVAAGVFALTLLITGCSTAEVPAAPDAAQSQGAEGTVAALAGLDAREVIEQLDTTALADRPDGLQASIRPDELVLVDASGDDLVMPMPEDQVYVAFAPYASQTHDCTFHAPNSCVGEMQDAAIAITITDAATGEVYVDEQATTYDNGFIGYWLPRDVDASVLVTAADGKSGSIEITTRGAAAPTCITTLQIA